MPCETTVGNLHCLTTHPRKEGRFLDRLIRLEDWLDARRSRQVLYRLDSRGLADIGLTEADLGRADPAAAWHDLLRG
jgi:uncharacterized protein YjiS (DUF1127 family)